MLLTFFRRESRCERCRILIAAQNAKIEFSIFSTLFVIFACYSVNSESLVATIVLLFALADMIYMTLASWFMRPLRMGAKRLLPKHEALRAFYFPWATPFVSQIPACICAGGPPRPPPPVLR